MSRSVLARSVFSGAVWNGSKILASALATPLLARLLGLEGYGQYAYYLAIIFLASSFANFGTSQTLTKHIAERPGDLAWRHALIAFCSKVHLVSALVTGSVVAGLVWWRAAAEPHAALILLAVVGALVCDQAWYFLRGVLYGLRQEALANGPATLGVILAPALGVGLALLGLGAAGVLLGLALANLLVVLMTVGLAYPSLGAQIVVRPSGVAPTENLPASRLLKFGVSSMLFTALSHGLYRADAILIRHFSNDAQAGLYAAAVQWSEFVWFVAIAVELVMLQATARLWAEQQLESITQMLSRALRYVALGTAFGLVIVCVFAESILRLYFGAEFAGASAALRILLPGVFGFALARVMWPVIQARGNALTLIAVMALATLMNLLLNVLMLPAWGARGAAIATCVSYSSVLVMYTRLLHRYGVRPLAGLAIGRLILLCATTMALLTPIAVFIPSALMATILGGVLATFSYGLGAFWFGLISVTEVQAILHSLPHPFRNPGVRIFTKLQPMLAHIGTK